MDYNKMARRSPMPVNSFIDYPMSWKPDRSRLKRPVYLSLARKLEEDILTGELAPGTKLPPQRELADYLDINFTTVTRAYKLCEEKGLLYGKTGSGTFVAPSTIRDHTISLIHSGGSIDLALVASFEQCNHMVKNAAKKAAGKNYFPLLLNYGDPTGIPHHKQAGLQWMEGFGVRAEEDCVAIASGGLNALALTLFGLFSPGDRIAVDRYTYANFIGLAKLSHVQFLPVEGDDEGMLAEELDLLCRNTKVRGVFLMPSCCNPTTTVISHRRKIRLAEIISKHGLILIEDDIHAFMAPGILEDYVCPLSMLVPDNSIYICSTSKALSSGLRVAYMVFGQPLKDPLLQAMFNINVKTSGLNAEIVTELITSGMAGAIMNEKKQLLTQANAMFNALFPESAGAGHPLSFFRWLPVPKEMDCIAGEERLLKAGVRVLRSGRFLSGPVKAGSGGDKGFLRISLSSTNSLEQLQIGLQILKRELSR